MLVAVAGWIGLLTGGTADAVGAAAARWYPLMVFAIPAWLIVTTFSELRRALATRHGAGSPGLLVGGSLIAIGEAEQAAEQYSSSADQFAQKVAKARETVGKK